MPNADWWKALWPAPGKVLAAVGLLPGADAVDLCCGNGWFTVPMAKVARKVIAIDIDRAQLEAAGERLKTAGIQNVLFVEGDAYDVAKLAPHPVDLVFMANSFHGVPEPTRLAREVARALKPGGRFVIVNWHRRRREETVVLGEPRGPATNLRMGPQTTQAVVEPAGLTLREIVEVPPYHYAAIFEKAGAK
jgi:ubiquinone/menaquinone biosynthesis C-methylase UbiE